MSQAIDDDSNQTGALLAGGIPNDVGSFLEIKQKTRGFGAKK